MLAKFPAKKEAERCVLIRKFDYVIHNCCLCLEDSNQNRSLCCSLCQAPASFCALPLCARVWLLLSPLMAPLDNNREVTGTSFWELGRTHTGLTGQRCALFSWYLVIKPFQPQTSYMYLCMSTSSSLSSSLCLLSCPRLWVLRHLCV